MEALIITGCISPNLNVPFVTVNDKEQRMLEYKKTIEWAILYTKFEYIIYVDTSFEKGDLECLYEYENIAIHNKKHLEIVSCEVDTDMVINLGKGYGEGEAIKYVILNSETFTKKNITFFYKITGRLTIENIKKISYKKYKKDKPLFLLNYPYADMIDTRFYGVPTKLYIMYFWNCHTKIDDKKWHCLEHVFFEICHKEHIKYRMFKLYPHYSGRSGSTGKIYSNDKKYLLFDILCGLRLFNRKKVMNVLRILRRINILN